MWDVYRKIALPAQVFVIVATVTAYFAAGRDLIAAGIVFAVMQLGVLTGALSVHAKAKRGPRAKPDAPLPLERR
ncbi:MAG TPA: hypothetical protein VEA69_17575 [Tepidisphaeraceae bacterium]|nr:hypothetical protein [Tepidisphaeraceae bacterium]